jgi:hypothetical protein
MYLHSGSIAGLLVTTFLAFSIFFLSTVTWKKCSHTKFCGLPPLYMVKVLLMNTISQRFSMSYNFQCSEINKCRHSSMRDKAYWFKCDIELFLYIWKWSHKHHDLGVIKSLIHVSLRWGISRLSDMGNSNWAHKLWSYIQWVSPRMGD